MAVVIVSVTLGGCATGAEPAGSTADTEPPVPVESSEPTVPVVGDEAALGQAQAWLDAANLPAGAIPSDTTPAAFSSYTGWPCGPYEELEAYWTIPGTTVVDAANWLIQNPTAELITTTFGPVTEEWGPIESAIVGDVPAPDSQEGIVYTLAKNGDGVAVRAEVAAQTHTATCPPLPDGGMYGAPGQG